jgi:hypothetical protein
MVLCYTMNNNEFTVLFLRSEFHVLMSITILAYKRCSVRAYFQLFVGGLTSCLRCLCCVFCFVFLCLVRLTLPFSLDCPFLIAPSVFSKVFYRMHTVFLYKLHVQLSGDLIISECTVGLGGYLMPFSTIFQLYRGGQFYWWRNLPKSLTNFVR